MEGPEREGERGGVRGERERERGRNRDCEYLKNWSDYFRTCL